MVKYTPDSNVKWITPDAEFNYGFFVYDTSSNKLTPSEFGFFRVNYAPDKPNLPYSSDSLYKVQTNSKTSKEGPNIQDRPGRNSYLGFSDFKEAPKNLDEYIQYVVEQATYLYKQYIYQLWTDTSDLPNGKKYKIKLSNGTKVVGTLEEIS